MRILSLNHKKQNQHEMVRMSCAAGGTSPLALQITRQLLSAGVKVAAGTFCYAKSCQSVFSFAHHSAFKGLAYTYRSRWSLSKHHRQSKGSLASSSCFPDFDKQNCKQQAHQIDHQIRQLSCQHIHLCCWLQVSMAALPSVLHRPFRCHYCDPT